MSAPESGKYKSKFVIKGSSSRSFRLESSGISEVIGSVPGRRSFHAGATITCSMVLSEYRTVPSARWLAEKFGFTTITNRSPKGPQ